MPPCHPLTRAAISTCRSRPLSLIARVPMSVCLHAMQQQPQAMRALVASFLILLLALPALSEGQVKRLRFESCSG